MKSEHDERECLTVFESFYRMRKHVVSAIVLFLALGITLLIWPGLFLRFACNIIGALLIAFGVVTLIGELRMPDRSMFTMGFGVVITAVGVVIIANPEMVSSIIPVVFGLILLFDGVSNIRQALGLRRFEVGNWAFLLLLGIVTLALGAVILLHPYGTAELAFRVMGAALIYNALSDLIIAVQMNRTAKKSGIYKEKGRAIDVDVRPVDDNE